MAAVAVLSVVGYILAIAATAPDLSELRPIDRGSLSKVYAANGELLGYVQSYNLRTPIPWRDMPPNLRNATVAIEDQRFYKHGGVDYESIVRAAFRNLKSGRTLQGGSTITQQLVRNLYIKSPKRDFARKIREAKLASELEKRHSKQWVLENYLNDIPYGTVNGRTAIGVEAAAETFFSKHARDLTLPEAALIAGLPQAPSEYNPFRNPDAALERRNQVLRKMAQMDYITDAEAQRAMRTGLGLRHGDTYTRRREPYFFDYVQEQLIERYGVNVVRKGGLKVHTTIYPALQDAARKAMANRLYLPTDPASAVVAIDPANGYIRAMASSSTYKSRTFNLAAQGHRQPGSSFKTFVLTTAIKRGVNPNTTTYVSQPLNLSTPYGPWQVKTYDNSYAGRINLVRATLRSDNSVYAQLDLDLGPKSVAETARSMGITTHLDGLPAEGLGGLKLGVSPLEMADAYATLASGGVHHKPLAITKVEFPDGKVDSFGTPKGRRVLTDGQAYEVTKILEQNVQAGTGTAANIGCPAAGKTGTTDNFNDAWFVGYTPRLAAAVWVGYPNALIEMRSVHGISVAGGTFPAQIWHDFMSVAKGSFCGGFPRPSTPVQWEPFYGKYSRSGGGYEGTGAYPPGTGTAPPPASNGGAAAPGTDNGYNPGGNGSPQQQAPGSGTGGGTVPPGGGYGGGDQGGAAAPGQ
ncbi:MAG: PBP1A family penicillin-binding protein [Thermoleophilaceae bacterium]|nr:PBP1A family penicillin-binding protein [Thermoleophilaceae bacterium]